MEKIDNSDWFHDLYSKEPEVILKNLQKIRALTTQNPPDISSHPGVIRRLVEILAKYDEPSMQYEAVWILTNITSGSTERVRSVVEAGAVPLLIGLLQSRDGDVKEQAVMTLGNIVGDSPQSRGYVLSLGIIEPLLNQIQHGVIPHVPRIRVSLIRNILWVITNICRHCNAPQPVTDLKKLLPTLCNLTQHTDTVVQSHTLWALSYLTSNENEVIPLVINSNIMPTLITLSSHLEPRIHVPALKTIRNIMEAIPAQRKHMLTSYSDRFTTEMKQELKDLVTDSD